MKTRGIQMSRAGQRGAGVGIRHASTDSFTELFILAAPIAKANGNDGRRWWDNNQHSRKYVAHGSAVKVGADRPPVYRPQPVRHCDPPKPLIVQAKLVSGQPKIYPNLNASAAIPVDRDEIFRLHSFFDNYRIIHGRQHGQLVPNSKYIFCRMTTGEMLLHPRYRHPAIAAGRPVLYAGEAYFDNGKLAWWSNGSGNYRPDAEHAAQAELPMDRFYTYQDVLRGRHKERIR